MFVIIVAPIVASMCNASISQNKFPRSQKSATVRPLLKKSNLNPMDLNSYCPISNLSFVSKLLEHTIDSRLTQHADKHNLFSPVQSAYRKHHSTETALVKIHNDLVISIDQYRWSSCISWLVVSLRYCWPASSPWNPSSPFLCHWLSPCLVQFIPLWPYSSGSHQQPGI